MECCDSGTRLDRMATAPTRRLRDKRSDDLLALVEGLVDRLSAWRERDDRASLFADLRGHFAAVERLLPREGAAELVSLWRGRLHPFFLQAPFVHRCYTKPFGYAGDFEMMNMIYRNLPEGETPLGRVLHQFMNAWRGAAAVRSRRRWILQRIQEHARTRPGRRRIASMACGPAHEMADLVRESSLSDDAEILCLDQDEGALAFAREGIARAVAETGSASRATCVNDSVRGLLKSKGAAYERQDFVYSLGLFDYLPDGPARAFASVLYGLLAPGGRLVIGNLSPHTDARFAIELACDWKLLYRSGPELLAVAGGLPAEAVVDVTVEPTGQNLFLVVDRPG